MKGLDSCSSGLVLICVVVEAATGNHVSELILPSCSSFQFLACGTLVFGRQKFAEQTGSGEPAPNVSGQKA